MAGLTISEEQMRGGGGVGRGDKERGTEIGM